MNRPQDTPEWSRPDRLLGALAGWWVVAGLTVAWFWTVMPWWAAVPGGVVVGTAAAVAVEFLVHEVALALRETRDRR